MSVLPTLGPLLLGGLVALFLSGTVSMQVLLYTSVYHTDSPWIRFLVYFIWVLDLLHSAFICVANWDYLIANWSDDSIADWIPWSIGGTVMLTALMTFIVQCFFAWRVHAVSFGKYAISLVLAAVASGRLIAALVSTAFMIHLRNYQAFREQVGWVFTLGLSLAALDDILVATALCFYLRKNRGAFSAMNAVIDTLTFYTIQNGTLTFVTTFISLILWVTVDNLIFLGLHFAITKLYANAFMSTLNARRALRLQHTSQENEHSLPVMLSDRHSRLRGRHLVQQPENIHMSPKQVEITIERSVQISTDFDHGEEGTSREGDSAKGREI